MSLNPNLRHLALLTLLAVGSSTQVMAQGVTFDDLIKAEIAAMNKGEGAKEQPMVLDEFKLAGVFDENGHYVAEIYYNGLKKEVVTNQIIDKRWKVESISAEKVKFVCIKDCLNAQPDSEVLL